MRALEYAEAVHAGQTRAIEEHLPHSPLAAQLCSEFGAFEGADAGACA